jgi:hypothetical protein
VVCERSVAANETWVVDFIHDSLISGRQFRAFVVFDEWSRESLAIEINLSLTRARTQGLEQLRSIALLPGSLTEKISRRIASARC